MNLNWCSRFDSYRLQRFDRGFMKKGKRYERARRIKKKIIVWILLATFLLVSLMSPLLVLLRSLRYSIPEDALIFILERIGYIRYVVPLQIILIVVVASFPVGKKKRKKND
ncbi:MAG: hypothetical protein LC687_00790 [Actinobacteria bacterium]|nr:hypothetical protein [Actinomycetota bacterium]